MEKREPSPATLAIHGDAETGAMADVSPPLHLSTTFRTGNDDGLVYAREDQPTRRRVEAVLGRLEGGTALMYSSGQAALAALLDHVRPRRVLMGEGGYYQSRDLIQHKGALTEPLGVEVQEGDLIWLETPQNPLGTVYPIAAWADRARSAGALLAVDSTLATPVLQQPLHHGADFVMHSTTKFISGHSDALGGVLVTADEERAGRLQKERTLTGAVPGALETWLTLRSLRSLVCRMETHDRNALEIATWFKVRGLPVFYAGLHEGGQLEVFSAQMRGGGGIVSVDFGNEKKARALGARLRYWQDATSLGGAESLVDWRYPYDPSLPPGLLRFSVGLEDPADLIADLEQALS